jgi:hypothetical protein
VKHRSPPVASEPFPRRPLRPLARPALLALLAAAFSCGDSGGGAAPAEPPALAPGEICDSSNSFAIKLTFDPPNVVVAPGQVRPVKLTVEPDMCEPKTATFTASDPSIAAAPGEAKLDLRHATYDFLVTGGAIGTSTITASMNGKDVNDTPYTSTADLAVEVRDPAPPTCAAGDVATATMGPGANVVKGQGALAKAYVSANPNAFVRTDEFALPPFPAEVACHEADLTADFTTAHLVKLGPAVTFGAKPPLSMGKALRREIEVAIPVNPAAFPTAARLRHLVVLYQGPRAKTVRAVPVASPRIEKDGADWLLKFQTPWFGTYQPAVEDVAGTRVHRRHLTHRAVIGFSMGGGGAGVFGARHHDEFDVIAPLGGPSDWTWLLWYIEQFALGGFCPAGKTCTPTPPNLYAMNEPYAHTMDFEHWFYQEGDGNGGHFPRSEYVQIFEDLALAMGNPNGSGPDPALMHVAAGPKKTDPWIAGDPSIGLPPGVDCSFTVEPIGDDPDEDRQREIEDKCKAWRCDPKNQWRAETGYFDDEYNPDGSLPVSTFCDGGQNGTSPYVNTWAPGGDKPVNLGLYVDVNKNGTRDQGEPIIRSGHEPYDDCGPDGLCDESEPGYDAEANPDPSQDDYDYMLNPTGTEANHRWDPGEPYRDFGLDGVADTASKNVAGDFGEGNGKYDEAPGLANFYANDPHQMIAGRVPNIPGGPLTDDALRRIDVLSDGGVRDLFNFATVASHLSGQLFARKGPNGLPVRSVAFYNGFQNLPGENPADPNNFDPSALRWADIAEMPSVRYGDLDATAKQIADGDGQHVGTVLQLLDRLETAFFYVGKAWPDADRTRTEASGEAPATRTKDASLQGPDLQAQLECEIAGHCEHIFTGEGTKRTGPIAVSLPPGYALEANVERGVTYPVLYVLHGYGQDPRDLEAVAIFTDNFMNVAQRSYATRLPKFIIVYVDGRCRVRPDGKPECIRGTFYMDSARDDGAKMDAWFDEVVRFVDKRYRTKGPADVDVVE